MLIPYAFWDRDGEVLEEYGDGLSSDYELHRLISSFLGDIDVTEEMKKTRRSHGG